MSAMNLGDAMRIEGLRKEAARHWAELQRLRCGLTIIKEAGAINGGAWCAAQARGYLEDLDFDQYPETGKPPK